MLKRLRVKFVCILMTVVVGMLCVIFGLIIHFSSLAMEEQSLRLMQAVSSYPAQLGRPGDGYQSEHVRLPFFLVQFNRNGELTAVSGGFYDLPDEAQIQQIAQTAFASQDQVGILDAYNLRFSKTPTRDGMKIVFADMSSERSTMTNLIQTCIFLGVCSSLVFFGISLFLAHWAVKPVEQAWQQQRQFVADASHELKTPLAVILTNAELLESPDYDPETRQRFVRNLKTMAQQMRGLVEGLLELARVDNGAVKANFIPLDLSTLVEEEMLPFEPLFFEKGLTLTTELTDSIRVKGSAAHLRQVLGILLDNAMKYASPGGEVTVRLAKHGVHALLSVASPGEEISQQDLQNIFKRFYRVEKARSRDGSYGLGLSIAQSIVEEHRGRIWAESRGGINTFFVQLPLASLTADAPQKHPAPDSGG